LCIYFSFKGSQGSFFFFLFDRYLPGGGSGAGGEEEPATVKVKAIKDIAKGEKVLVHYLGGNAVKDSWIKGVCKCCNT